MYVYVFLGCVVALKFSNRVFAALDVLGADQRKHRRPLKADIHEFHHIVTLYKYNI